MLISSSKSWDKIYSIYYLYNHGGHAISNLLNKYYSKYYKKWPERFKNQEKKVGS